MASRIGKYKVSKKESVISLADGGAIDGRLTRLTPEVIFDWDYISCPAPIISNFGSSAHGVLADGDQFGAIFPGTNGEMYAAQISNVGAFTVAGNYFQTQAGSSVATDTNNTAAGLNLQGDDETADNLGLEMILGGTAMGSV